MRVERKQVFLVERTVTKLIMSPFFEQRNRQTQEPSENGEKIPPSV